MKDETKIIVAEKKLIDKFDISGDTNHPNRKKRKSNYNRLRRFARRKLKQQLKVIVDE